MKRSVSVVSGVGMYGDEREQTWHDAHAGSMTADGGREIRMERKTYDEG